MSNLKSVSSQQVFRDTSDVLKALSILAGSMANQPANPPPHVAAAAHVVSSLSCSLLRGRFVDLAMFGLWGDPID